MALHHALRGDRLRLGTEQGLKPAVFDTLQRGTPRCKRNLHDFTVFRNPDLVDQTEFHGIVGILDGDPHYAVADSEDYPREHSAVVVMYAKHLTLSCALQRHCGSASRTTTVLIARHRRLSVTPWEIGILPTPGSECRELFRRLARKHP